ncbi:MAG: phospho-N-acetylmuramoyl-pentapeptide-transferase [Candidatus Omnitrophica bacterium]|nr:phospho-N-acetylmuramoyl-pentapeptide-transferase [Candidatus Omnitrophota bacterium]
MLYHFLYPLREYFFGFNVLKYITFRSALCSVIAFLLSIIFGPLIIKKLKGLKIGENIRREDSVKRLYELQRNKEGTPTMGGVLILLSMILSIILCADLTNVYIQLTLFATVCLGGIGFLDDFIKLKKKRSLGLKPSVKLIGQTIIGLIIAILLYINPETNKSLDVPFFKKASFDMGVWFIPFVVLVIVGSSNAVNLTDGLDGLAIGCTVMVALAYSGFSYVSGHKDFSRYLNIFYVPGSGELAIFCASIVGAGLGFLWYNCYPASIFMGDTGSVALGGAIGTVAVFIKKELVLVLVGGIFVFEALSVILQTSSFKLRKKRVFLMAPLHHHFQLKGWEESKVTIRFWIVAAILVLFSLSTLKLR